MEDRMEAKEFLGRGIHFPIKPEAASGRIKMVSAEEDIRQAIRIILGTRKGERVMHPDFGCGIHDYAFGTMDYTTLSMIEGSVREALIQWEPRIRDVEVSAKEDPRNDGVLRITISYVVRTTNNPYNLVYPFYMREGME